jgi:CRP/FNR family cyclic AMP-dependent transcriptional regulator
LRQGWLANQPVEFQQEAIRHATLRTFGAGDYFHHAGDDPGGVHGIVSGGVGVLVPGRGTAIRLAGVLRTGIWFGHGPVMTGRPRVLTFRAMETSQTLYIPLQALQQLMAFDPAFARAVGSLSDFTMDFAIATVADLLIPDSARRLAAVVLRSVDAQPDGGSMQPLVLRLRQSELAEMANLSERMVGRILKRFEASGWTAAGYGGLTLVDLKALLAFSAEN